MFLLAFKSRETISQHHLHSRSLSFNVNSWFIHQHLLHILLDGNHLSILTILFQYQSALYSNIETKDDHATSDTAQASLWLDSIPFTFKSSRHTTWLSWIILVETLCKKSCLWLLTFMCNFCSFFNVFFHLCFEYLRWIYFSLNCFYFRYLLFSKVFQSLHIAKSFIHKSIHTFLSTN